MTGVLDFGIGNIASVLNMIECVHGKGMAVGKCLIRNFIHIQAQEGEAC